MLNGTYKVVAVTPAGRKRYLAVLLPYLLKNRHLIDEYHLWVNTKDEWDIGYIKSLRDKWPEFIRLIWPSLPPAGSASVFHYYRYCIDERTIYIKLDDDICFIQDGALEELLRFRLQHRHFFLVYPNIINTAFSSYIHQQMGTVGRSSGEFRYDPHCELGWRSGRSASLLHAEFFRRHANGSLDDYKYSEWVLYGFPRCSINCISWFGEDFSEFGGIVGSPDDEEWLSVDKPKKINRPNCLCGTSLMVHFAYYTQRAYLESRTDFLLRYRRLAPRSFA